MSEFKPTKSDLLNIESRILDIKKSRNDLIARKRIIEYALSQLKSKYGDVEFMKPEFRKIKQDRLGLKDEFNKIELEIKGLNDEIIYKNKLKLEVEFYLRNNSQPVNDENSAKLINRLTLLRQKYSDFSVDKTRIASLRIMASELTREIDIIMKLIK
jgi:hypothetical protein